MDTKLFVRRQAGGMFAVIDKSITTGDIFWVDSGSATGADSVGYGQSPDAPFLTLDYAVGQTTASNGDRIFVMPGHVETVSAAAGLALDKAAITIEFLGEGNARGSINFGTAGTADMDVDAADVTLINPRFVAAVDALAGPIDVNAARFKMVNATWQDGTTINTTDCLVADANADDMTIDGFEFIDGDAGGTQKQSFIQVAAATRPVIKRVKCTGNFGTGIIENGTAWIDAYLEDLELDNAAAGPVVGIFLSATSSGQAHRCNVRVASGAVYVTADNDMQWFECFGTGTDATAGEKIGTILSGDIEGKVDSVGTATTSVGTGTASQTLSVGLAAASVGTATTSVGTGTASQTLSVGLAAASVGTATTSVGTGTASQTLSIGLAAASVGTATTSVGTGTASQTLSIGLAAASVGTAVSSVGTATTSVGTGTASQTLSIGLAAASVGTAVTSVGTGTATTSSIATNVLAHTQQLSRNLVRKTVTYSGGGSYTAFTVTGAVAVTVIGYVTTALTNHADTTSVGTATSAAGIIAATAGTAMQGTSQLWTDAAPSKFETFPTATYGISENIAVVGTANLVGGVVELYCFWIPLSTDGNVVAA